ncbi:MAG: HRDC domain-containing protein [Verrucomicrobiales bacterium]|jgi:ribonuclease D|nr:HRDC domain-containing protein [Verrucomicrobiales bacterium]
MSQSELESLASVSEDYIDDVEGLRAFVRKAEDLGHFGACSIDTEADSMHSYETKLCLIQFSIPGALAIFDPLAIGIDALREFTLFVDRFEIVWMHGADYDISLFNSTFNWVPRKIYDTQVGARFLGKEKFGLANLLEDEYGIKLSKQSQKADWSRRPLNEKMLAYAFNDVRYLLDLGGKYLDRLAEAERLGWFVESCLAAQGTVLCRTGKSEDEVWRVTGWGKLSSKGLHFLKHLWMWRDEECKRLDRPAFKFLGNQEIVNMAEQLEMGREVNPPHYLRPGPVKRLHDAIDLAKRVKSSDYPVKHRRGEGNRLEIDEVKFEKIRRFRDQKAGELGIEPTVIATRSSMERLAATNLSESEKQDALLCWQKEILSPCL